MTKSILVVEDSPSMLAMLCDLLKSFGYQVTGVESGREGCELVEKNQYNLIFTDLNMPGMDGVEFTQKVKQMENCKFVPIVMLSGEHDQGKIKEARNIGVSTFLEKPFKPSKLKAILQIVLG